MADKASILRMDMLEQSGIDGCLVFRMLAFEPFQNISIKPQSYMLFNGAIEFAPHSARPVEDFRNVGKIESVTLAMMRSNKFSML
jgi:hypothetical protein